MWKYFPLKGNIDNYVKNPHPHGKILVKYTKNVTYLHADGKHKETSETRIYISNLEYGGEKTAKQCLSSIQDYCMVQAYHCTLDTS